MNEPTTALRPAEPQTLAEPANPMGLIPVSQLTAEQVGLIKRTICKGATDDELTLFIGQCNRTGLDPFSKQIHAVKRWDSKQQREVMSIQVGIDGFRVIAERSKKLDGQEGPFWCGDNGEWKDVWLDPKPPVAAKVVVWRAGCSKPFTGIARYSSYVQTTKDGAPNQFWKRMPEAMIAKVAECLALRKAFPQDLSGLYSPEESVSEDETEHRTPPHENSNANAEIISELEAEELRFMAESLPLADASALLNWAGVSSWEFFPKSKYKKAVEALKRKAGQ